MSNNTVTRFTWTDDSGSGLDGTIINNAQLQAIFDAVDGAITPVVQVKTSNYTVLITDDLLIANSGTFTFTLPTAVGHDGKELAFVNRGTGSVTVDGNGTETIDGDLTVLLNDGKAIVIRSDGANWVIVAKNGGGTFLPSNAVGIAMGLV